MDQKKRSRSDGTKDDPKEPVDTITNSTAKRQNIRNKKNCSCNCQDDSVIQLEDEQEGSVRCECNLCGTNNTNGTRQCIIDLNSAGASISVALDGRLICFDCRGCESLFSSKK